MGPKCFIDPVVTPKIEFAEGKLSTTRTRRSGFSKEMLQDFTGFGTDDWKIDLSLYAALKHSISRIGIQNNLILRRMVFAKTGAEPREKPRILSRFIQVLNHTQPQHVSKNRQTACNLVLSCSIHLPAFLGVVPNSAQLQLLSVDGHAKGQQDTYALNCTSCKTLGLKNLVPSIQ